MARKRKAANLDSDSDYEDASYEPQTVKDEDEDDWKPATSAKTKGKSKKRRVRSQDDVLMNESEGDTAETAQACPHAASVHVLSSPESPREALLKWYEGVHASRGMPWRKPYNHAWDPEQKGQRAYEVSSFPSGLCLSFDFDFR